MPKKTTTVKKTSQANNIAGKKGKSIAGPNATLGNKLQQMANKKRGAGGLKSTPKKRTINRRTKKRRRPSSSTYKQGDHIVAFTLMDSAVTACLNFSSNEEIGEALIELIDDAIGHVNSRNYTWHRQADMLKTLYSKWDDNTDITPSDLLVVKGEVLTLLNIMPHTTVVKRKTGGGHGEGGNINGLEYLESQLIKGNTPPGNPYVNVLGLIDFFADKKLLDESDKLLNKITWLMQLIKRAAPNVFKQLQEDKKHNKKASDRVITEALDQFLDIDYNDQKQEILKQINKQLAS